uniref:Endonuclease/exonuclease/phosphatase domain-containing protein n=1 Tax=Bracon brevicornis TaxID=1563983 RepID=A0A6V7M0X4_9HYME
MLTIGHQHYKTKLDNALSRNKKNITNNPTIIGGDLNAKHIPWGSTKNNPLGVNSLNPIQFFRLIRLNDGSTTHIDKAKNDLEV